MPCNVVHHIFLGTRLAEFLSNIQDQITKTPGFKGNISDLGGPSANMYKMKGVDLSICAKCRRPSCIFPEICFNLSTNHKPLTQLYRKAEAHPGIKRVFVGSGVRYDLFIDKTKEDDKKNGYTEYAEQLILDVGARPAFKGFSGFSGTLCTSVNDAVVHGVPSKNKILKEGDIIGLDIGMQWPKKNGLYTDMARTVGVGNISEEAKKLIEVTKKSFYKAVDVVKSGARVGDIGEAVQKYVESEGYSVVRSLSGHGVGYEVHEDPRIANYGKAGTGEILRAGMVLAIEPMVCVGGYELETLADGWTAVTKDGSLTSHHENTLVVTEKGCEILTLNI